MGDFPMRISIATPIAVLTLLASPLFAQSNPYPWQAGQTQSPAAPQMQARPIFSNVGHAPIGSMLQDDAGQSAQLTDQDKVPTAPNVPQNQSGEPALSVPSNALPEDYNYCNRDCNTCNLGCPKTLFGTTCNGLHVGGWVQTGYHNRNTRMFNNRKGTFQLHQGWLFLDKATSANSNWGYRVDTIYGIDGQDLQAFGNPPTGNPSGWDNSWDFGAYGWALPQAYVEYGDGNSTIRAGKFLSPFGYEGLPAVENFFYSHTYTRYFTEPFSHTGVIAEFQNAPGSATMLGVTAGWDTAFDNNEHGFNVLVGSRRQLTDTLRVYSTAALGDMGTRGSGTLSSFIAESQLASNMHYVLQVDMLNLNTNSVDEFGVVQYLFYNVNPCLGFGTRLEWWKTDQLFTSTRSTWDWTLGMNYRPHANVVIRPEIRMDWGAAAVDVGEGIVGIDAIVTF